MLKCLFKTLSTGILWFLTRVCKYLEIGNNLYCLNFKKIIFFKFKILYKFLLPQTGELADFQIFVNISTIMRYFVMKIFLNSQFSSLKSFLTISDHENRYFLTKIQKSASCHLFSKCVCGVDIIYFCEKLIYKYFRPV